jgi:hypothetical protein
MAEHCECMLPNGDVQSMNGVLHVRVYANIRVNPDFKPTHLTQHVAKAILVLGK